MGIITSFKNAVANVQNIIAWVKYAVEILNWIAVSLNSFPPIPDKLKGTKNEAAADPVKSETTGSGV